MMFDEEELIQQSEKIPSRGMKSRNAVKMPRGGGTRNNSPT